MNWKKFLPAIVILSLAILSGIFPGHPFDMQCFREWAIDIHNRGIAAAYDGSYKNDYLPVYNYVLWMYGFIAGGPVAIGENIHMLRLVTLSCDIVVLYYLYLWIGKKYTFSSILLVTLLNPAFIYNTIVWGQVDSILSALLFISLYYAYRHKMVASAVLMTVALNFKLQAIIFIPIWLILYAWNLSDKPSLKKMGIPLLAMIVTQFILLIPFLFSPSIYWLWKTVAASFGKYPVISMNAFNIWHIIVPDGVWGNDSEIFAGMMTFKSLGMILFLLASIVVLWPLAIRLYRNLSKRTTWMDKDKVWLACALITLSFFFFNTEMHERYSHYAFIFITAYSVSTRNFLPYILFSCIYFLHLESILHSIPLNIHKIILFDHVFIAVWMLILLLVLFVFYYRKPADKSAVLNAAAK
jgi:Gpi18-like mannosyltransferase